MKLCKNCQTGMSDFSFSSPLNKEIKVEHYYCSTCKTHLFKGEWLDKAKWDKWINEDSL